MRCLLLALGSNILGIRRYTYEAVDKCPGLGISVPMWIAVHLVGRIESRMMAFDDYDGVDIDIGRKVVFLSHRTEGFAYSRDLDFLDGIILSCSNAVSIVDDVLGKLPGVGIGSSAFFCPVFQALHHHLLDCGDSLPVFDVECLQSHGAQTLPS